ncbi:hypothetical protein LA66_04740 [Aureimonas altamirensis]|uniref:Uncharacterized protein n=1 Tax=Aureimonas altamirensis TaxID=370622 RepID=A0A0B1QAS3_9HYPH|nr:hypothetical protein [Aureimonas altamirensis]KHJ55930.1 hypothetical protein LA66_04740 [Aureimonas altamirensis]
MLAAALFFLLGALVAVLGALLLVPLVWRKAQSLAWREAEATMPMSLSEIRAETDKVRAEAAMAVRRAELQAADAREQAARARAEAGRLTARTVLSGVATPETQMPRSAEDTLEALRQTAPAASGELEALNARLQEMDEDSGESRMVLAAALMRIEQLELDLLAARRKGPADEKPVGADPSKAEILRRDGIGGGLRVDILARAEEADPARRRAAIREKLDEIAATVAAISLAAAPEGSNLSRLADDARSDPGTISGTLARRLVSDPHGA